MWAKSCRLHQKAMLTDGYTYYQLLLLVMPRKDLAYMEVEKKKLIVRNHRAKRIQHLRYKLRTLNRKHKQASEEERQLLIELREVLKVKLRYIQKAEWHRRHQKETVRKRYLFLADPFGFARKLLSDKRSSQLKCSAEDMNTYLWDT